MSRGIRDYQLVCVGGHAVRKYPDSAWQRMPAGVNIDHIWQLVGPQVAMHMRKDFPLWKVFCAVYYEGIVHACGVLADQERDDDVRGPQEEQPVASVAAIEDW